MTPSAAPTVIDWTPIVLILLNGAIGVIGSVFLWFLQSHMKDQAAAATLGSAVKNALGAAQNAVDAGLASHPLQTTLPAGTSPAVAAGVSYVISQAGPEMTRLGITPDAVAAKVAAQIGLSNVPSVAPVVGAPVVAPVRVS
jgi:hypothetical protein